MEMFAVFCSGCGLKDVCNFPVTLNWTDVERYQLRQRVWLFASLDGHYFFQTGWAPIVENVTGSAVVNDGCFGEPGFPMVLVACLSDRNLQDSSFEGFPVKSCNSTWGLCVTSESALVDSLDVCLADGEWEGNTYIYSWDGPGYSKASSIRCNLLCLLLLIYFVH